jgi:hypothetical protein
MAGPLGYHRLGSVFPRAMLRKAYPTPPRTSGRVAFLVPGVPGGDYTLTLSPGVFVLTFSQATIYEGSPGLCDFIVMASQEWPEVVTVGPYGVSMTMASTPCWEVSYSEVVRFDPSPSCSIAKETTACQLVAVESSCLRLEWSESVHGEHAWEKSMSSASRRREDYAVVAKW